MCSYFYCISEFPVTVPHAFPVWIRFAEKDSIGGEKFSLDTERDLRRPLPSLYLLRCVSPLLFFCAARAQLCAEHTLAATTNGNVERGITCHLVCGGHCLHRASPPDRGSTSERKPPAAPAGLAFSASRFARRTKWRFIAPHRNNVHWSYRPPMTRSNRATIDRSPATPRFVSRAKRRTRSCGFQGGKNFRAVA